MIASKANDPARIHALPFDQQLNNAPRFGAPINIVPEKDVLGLFGAIERLAPFKQRDEIGQTAMNVSDRKRNPGLRGLLNFPHEQTDAMRQIRRKPKYFSKKFHNA